MTKKEFQKLLDELDIAVNEGLQSDKNTNVYPRIIYFETMWEDINASGESYDTTVTYQVSFFSDEPRHKKLLELRKLFADKGIRPMFMHEYIDEEQEFHSAFTVDVLEEL